MSGPDELGPVSNPAHECSFQKRIEKGEQCLMITYCAEQIFN